LSRRFPKLLSLFVILLIAAVILFLYYRRNPNKPCQAQIISIPRPEDPNVMPGGRAEDIAMAQSDPDEYAWKLFLAMNRQALLGKRGVPDPNRPTIHEYEDDTPVIWETWALSSGGRNNTRPLPEKNTSEVFKDMGEKPDPWDQLKPETKALELFPSKQSAGFSQLLDSQRTASLMKAGLSEQDAAHISSQTSAERFIEPGLGEESQGIGEEVRMNRTNFEHVVAHNLYNLEGLEEAFRKYRDSPDPTKPEKIDVPAASQEIKAKWVRIREEDKPRYHWRALRGKDGQTQIWGLSALHITTKDLQDWFWSDFEHIDYLQLPVQSVDRNFGSNLVDRGEVPSRDTTTRTYGQKTPNHAAKDCKGKLIEGVREETAGTKWANYRLRGTQTTFTCGDLRDCKEIPTVLANTQLERGFQQTSSCITCHGRASIGERKDPLNDFFPKRMNVFLSVQFLRPAGFNLIGAVGKIQDEWFRDPKTQKLIFAPTDFMWTLSERAMSKTAPKPTKPTPTPAANPTTCGQPCPVPSPPTPSPTPTMTGPKH
jgi:hypothetical protein